MTSCVERIDETNKWAWCVMYKPQARLEEVARSLHLKLRSNIEKTAPPEYVVANRNCPKLRRKLKELHVQPELVRSSWLDECKQRALLVPARSHPLRLFEGLVLSSTGFASKSERSSIAELVQQYAGTFLYTLDTGRVTHLIAATTESKKFEVAFTEGIPIVSASWVHDSINANQLLDERKYTLQSPHGQTAHVYEDARQAADHLRPTDQFVDGPGGSAAAPSAKLVKGGGGFQTVGRGATSTVLARMANSTLPQPRDTTPAAEDASLGIDPSTTAGDASPNDFQYDAAPAAPALSSASLGHSGSQPLTEHAGRKESHAAATISAWNAQSHDQVTSDPQSAWQQLFLTAAVVMLVGYDAPQESNDTARLMTLLAAAGAIISTESSEVTHAVVHPRVTPEQKITLPSSTRFVSADWVYDSHAANTHLLEWPYHVDPTRIGCRSQRYNELKLPSKVEDLVVHIHDSLSEEAANTVRSLATSGGLSITRSRADAHVTIQEHCKGFGAQREVTPFFLERCVNDQHVHNPTLTTAFKPIPYISQESIRDAQQAFEGVNVCATGFTQLLRHAASKFCGLLGARYEDTLIGKGKNQTTHLLCERESQLNSKCKKARQIGAKIVTMSWLVDSAWHMSKAREEDYYPEVAMEKVLPSSQCAGNGTAPDTPRSEPARQNRMSDQMDHSLEGIEADYIGNNVSNKRQTPDRATGIEDGYGNRDESNGVRNLVSEIGDLLNREQTFLGNASALAAESQAMPAGQSSPQRHAHAPSPARKFRQQSSEQKKKAVGEEEATLSQLPESQRPRVEIAEPPIKKRKHASSVSHTNSVQFGRSANESTVNAEHAEPQALRELLNGEQSISERRHKNQGIEE